MKILRHTEEEEHSATAGRKGELRLGFKQLLLLWCISCWSD